MSDYPKRLNVWVEWDSCDNRFKEIRAEYLMKGDIATTSMNDLLEIAESAIKAWYGQSYLYEQCRNREKAREHLAWEPNDIIKREG